jgi:hypothetical protein
MSSTVLKKEFREKDVQRLRNLVTNKYGDKTAVSVGYNKDNVTHNEGDIWEEDGRTWTIQDGIRLNVTKLDEAKKSATMPLFCPSCNKLMKHKFDKSVYRQYKRCYDCNLHFEGKLRREGLWDHYEKSIINSDIDGLKRDFTAFMESLLTDSNQGYVTEQGDVEQWTSSGADKELLKKQLDETITYLDSLKK